MNGNATELESLLSRFTVGVIAAQNQLGPREFVYDDHQPFEGNVLKVKWWAVIGMLTIPIASCNRTKLIISPKALICGLIGVQLICSAVAIWFSNTVVVKDGSYVSTARLLRRKYISLTFWF